MIWRLEHTSRTGGRVVTEFGDYWTALHRLRGCNCEATLTDDGGRVVWRVVRNDGRIADRRVRWIVQEGK